MQHFNFKVQILHFEIVLNGDIVVYAPYETIILALQYDFEKEKEFSYKDLSLEKMANVMVSG